MRMTVIERAYDLARGGECRNLSDISATLKRERFSSVDAHLQGGTIRKSLNAVLAARQASERSPQPAE
jgi:hypothetical protein